MNEKIMFLINKLNLCENNSSERRQFYFLIPNSFQWFYSSNFGLLQDLSKCQYILHKVGTIPKFLNADNLINTFNYKINWLVIQQIICLKLFKLVFNHVTLNICWDTRSECLNNGYEGCILNLEIIILSALKDAPSCCIYWINF